MLTKYVYIVCLIPVATVQTHNQRIKTTTISENLKALRRFHISIFVSVSRWFCWWMFIIHMTIRFHAVLYFVIIYLYISRNLYEYSFDLRNIILLLLRTHTQKNAHIEKMSSARFYDNSKNNFANLLCTSRNKKKGYTLIALVKRIFNKMWSI